MRLNEDLPGSALQLGLRTFGRELGQLCLWLRQQGQAPLAAGLARAMGLEETPPKAPACVAQLTLDVQEVMSRERRRGVPESAPPVKARAHGSQGRLLIETF